MRRFLREFIKFALLQAVVLGASFVTFFGMPNKYAFLAASLDKKARLESVEGPRLIVVGDSGGAYGIYSPILKERFPGYEPVNMALMAAVGMPTMLAEVRDELRPGDVVVLILAYQHYDRYVPSWEFFNYVAYRPDMAFTKPPREWTAMGDIAFYFFHRSIRSLTRALTIGPHVPKKPPMCREGFNEYGDLVAHHDMPPVPDVPLSMADITFPDPDYAEMIVGDLNAFAEDAAERGARVFLLNPSISESTWEENGAVLRKMMDYSQRFFTFPVLNNVDEVVYPDTDFFDTFYHLTGDAAKRRTEFLADRLEPYLDDDAPTDQVAPR